MPFRTFKREYPRIFKKHPQSSILACILFKRFGISTTRLRAMLDKYEQAIGTRDVCLEGAERVFAIGITVLDKNSGQIVRHRTPGYRENIVIDYDPRTRLYSESSSTKTPGRAFACQLCKSFYNCQRSFLNHKRLGRCSPHVTKKTHVGGAFLSK